MTDQLDLFKGSGREVTAISPEAGTLRAATGALARRGVFLGTSSWKYPGWQGLLYSPERYRSRGRFSETRFNRECLAEYAETFPTVCVDGAYYQFPSVKYLSGIAAQVPEGFKFSFKVTDEITLRHFPRIARMGPRAGQPNPHFLDADLFIERFLGPCEVIRSRVGLLMFEFSRFHPADFRDPEEFAETLHGFLDRLPRGWEYGVEIRNEEFLGAAYCRVLRQHGVAHVYNSWEAMPPVEEQLKRVGDALEGVPVGARFLLRPGRSYEQAVKTFSPYQRIGQVYEEGRAAAAALIERALRRGTRLYLYGNNRLEGCSPLTLLSIIQRLPEALWNEAPR